MIQAQNLTKRYGSRKAISNVSFTVNRGEVVGFLGPNGAGKTTTMKILTGYMAPHKGSVYLDRVDVFENPFTAKKKLGYLPEVPPLYFDMIVEDYLKYVTRLKLCPKKKISHLVEEAIKKAGLKDVRKRLIQNLSKGFKQRTGLAQALVSDPDILVLDEPTVGLDPQQVVEFRDTLKKLKGQHTIILSTHILPEVQATCDRVIIINEGKIVTEDSLDSLNQKSAKRRIFVRMRKPSDFVLKQIKSIKGVLSVQKSGSGCEVDLGLDENLEEKVAKAVIDSSGGLMELKVQDSLENLFIHFTGKKEGK